MVKKLIFLIITLTSAFLIKNLYYQEIYYNQAKLDCRNKDLIKCIDNYEKVILSYTPFSDKVHDSVYSLYSLCKEIYRLDEKMYCYETIASSLSQIRSLSNPYSDVRFKAKDALFELKTTSINSLKSEDLKTLKDAQSKLIFHDEYSSPFWSLISVLSLFVWVSLIVYGIMYIDLKVNNKNLIYLFVFIFSLLLWIVGLYMA